MSHATRVVDEAADPVVALTVQQIIAAAATAGTAGVGISSVAIDGSNHLIVTLTDATTIDAGLLPSGADGMDGIDGPAGADGMDGIDGPAGVGISSVAINGSNHLIVTLTDASTVDAGELPTGGSGLTTQQAAKLAAIDIDTAETFAVDRGLQLALYDHTIAAGETDSPPAATIFRSTVDGQTYNRLADGSTNLLDNVASEYGAAGGCCVQIPAMVAFGFENAPAATPWPDEIQAGDVVIMYRIATAAMTTPAGWTRLKYYDYANGSAMEVALITADGTESGNMPDDNETNRWVFVIRGTTAAKTFWGSSSFDTVSTAPQVFPYLTEAALKIALLLGFSSSSNSTTFLSTVAPASNVPGTYSGNHIVFNTHAFLNATQLNASVSPSNGVSNIGHLFAIGFIA